jgi:predicted RNase H-like nuclease (RuvC/YqgF family)
MPNNPPNEFLTEEELDLPHGSGSEELESEVRRAKAELDELRRKQEQIEKEKLRLEELSRRQEALEEGKAEMVEKLTRSLGIIARETEEGQQRLEQLRVIQRSFTDHLSLLERLNPRAWSANDAGREFAKGQGILDEARADYNKAQARLAIEAPDSAAASDMLDYEEEDSPKDFLYWLKSGFAFTLPIQILGIIGLILWALNSLGSR